MKKNAINLKQKLGLFTEQWSPKVIAEMDGFQFRLAKLQGDFVWHSHEESDEAFFVVKGNLRIDFRDGSSTLGEGDLLVVPKGIEHKPYAEEECHVLVFIRAGTLNTGDVQNSPRTTDPNAKI